MTIFRCKSAGGLCAFAVVFMTSACDDGREVGGNQLAFEEIVVVTTDVPAMIGMTKAEVEKLWGKPSCPSRNACDYGGRREVYFVGNKAANITLPPVDDLRMYGFDLGAPVFENADAGIRRWNATIKGRFAEVSHFTNYVYVKTQES